MTKRRIFLTGGTGFIGSALCDELLKRGHAVRALVRPGSEGKLPPGCEPVPGDALDGSTYAQHIASCDTFVHLVGVAHPSPSKAAEFRAVDLRSIREAVTAAKRAGVRHFIYLSVARPAPIMHEYQAVRAEGESLIEEARLAATFIRPWYVLGPGRRWPLMLVPMYALARLIPGTRDGAERLALVTRGQMVQTLAWAVENPGDGIRALEPREIRAGGNSGAQARSQAA
jgi:nucleoside-diphosphate-sugar epimerase